ncbi:MAG: hypothetical protein EON96_02765, partial [Caulobacteraceae bacterium]
MTAQPPDLSASKTASTGCSSVVAAMQDGMQAYALTVDKFLTHAARWFPDVEVVSCDIEGQTSRMGYAKVEARSRRLSGALLDLGLRPGDIVATLAWNTRPHLEIWYAVMGVGMACHTLNPRLPVTQLASMVQQSGATVLAFGAGLSPVAEEIMLAAVADPALSILHAANWYYTSATTGVRFSFIRSFINTYLNIDGTPFTNNPGYATLQFKDEVKGRDRRLEQTIRMGSYKRINGTSQVAAPPVFTYSYTGYMPIKWSLD